MLLLFQAMLKVVRALAQRLVKIHFVAARSDASPAGSPSPTPGRIFLRLRQLPRGHIGVLLQLKLRRIAGVQGVLQLVRQLGVLLTASICTSAICRRALKTCVLHSSVTASSFSCCSCIKVVRLFPPPRVLIQLLRNWDTRSDHAFWRI